MNEDARHKPYEERRRLVTDKLLVMQHCYAARDTNNYGRFIDAFHGIDSVPVIIGTDGGAWFTTPERVKWLKSYELNTWTSHMTAINGREKNILWKRFLTKQKDFLKRAFCMTKK